MRIAALILAVLVSVFAIWLGSRSAARCEVRRAASGYASVHFIGPFMVYASRPDDQATEVQAASLCREFLHMQEPSTLIETIRP